MSFSFYQEYKSTGTYWLEKIPAQWKMGALRWLSKRYSGGTPDKSKQEFWERGTIPWINSGSVNNRLIKEPSAHITENGFQSSSAKWISKGSLVIALAGQGKTKGMVAQLAIDTTCNQSMAAIIPDEIINSRYLYWWLDSNYENIRNMAGGDLRDGLNLEMLGNIPCPIPSQIEQSKISIFLDKETAKIDGLVFEQEKLITLLIEGRQTAISNSVTRGLRSSINLKKSNIDWLGEYPEHWTLSVLRRCVKEHKQGYYSSDEYVDKGIKLLRITDLNGDGTINYENCPLVNENSEVKDFLLKEGDFVFARTGGAGTFGKVGTIFEDIAFASYLIRFRFSPELFPDFLKYYFQSDLFIMGVESMIHGGVNKNIHAEDIKNQTIVYPGLTEQKEIAKYLDELTKAYSELVNEATNVINLLKERRAALISAAVTGQIDVREYQPKEVA